MFDAAPSKINRINTRLSALSSRLYNQIKAIIKNIEKVIVSATGTGMLKAMPWLADGYHPKNCVKRAGRANASIEKNFNNRSAKNKNPPEAIKARRTLLFIYKQSLIIIPG